MKRSSLLALCLFLSATASAHEVSASRVKVHQSGNAIELWQTTPYITAHNLVAPDLETKSSRAVADQLALRKIAKGWRLTTDKGDCQLKKHAHRRVHHETQLQFRYLFICPDGAGAPKMSMNWLNGTPAEHFIFLDLETSRGLRTRIIERPQTSIQLNGASTEGSP